MLITLPLEHGLCWALGSYSCQVKAQGLDILLKGHL